MRVQGICNGVHEQEGVPVEEHGAMVLVGDVEVLLEVTAGHEACHLLDANDAPGSVKVVGQSALVRSARRTRLPGEDLELVSRAPAVLVKRQELFHESGEATSVKTLETAHGRSTGGRPRWHAC